MSENAEEARRRVISFTWKKTLVYSLIPLIVLCLVLEGSFRAVEVWLPPWQPDYGWGFNSESRVFIPNPKAPGTLITAPVKSLTFFNKQSFAMPKPPGTFRVFAIGGSSV